MTSLFMVTQTCGCASAVPVMAIKARARATRIPKADFASVQGIADRYLEEQIARAGPGRRDRERLRAVQQVQGFLVQDGRARAFDNVRAHNVASGVEDERNPYGSLMCPRAGLMRIAFELIEA